jgi:hypothetical protein
MEFLDPSKAHQRFSIVEAFDFLGCYSLPLIPEDRPVVGRNCQYPTTNLFDVTSDKGRMLHSQLHHIGSLNYHISHMV